MRLLPLLALVSLVAFCASENEVYHEEEEYYEDEDESYENSTLSDEILEIERTPRIIGGDDVQAGEYPWFAKGLRPSGSFAGCSGVLVSSEYVLTAAHCLGSFRKFQIGALCNDDDNCGQESETIWIEDEFVHPEYDNESLDFDVALVKLRNASTIQPATLDMKNLVGKYEHGDDDLWVMGFGLTDENNSSSTSEHLQHVDVSFIDFEICNTNYRETLTESMMCAAEFSKDACNGDSGGALFDAKHGLVVGIVSSGYKCNQERFPGIYSKVYDSFDWILNTICFTGGHDSPKPEFCEGVTAQPTLAPTPTPTIKSTCRHKHKNRFELRIKTDRFSEEENRFIVKMRRNGKFKKARFRSRFGQLLSHKEYLLSKCLNKNKCYKLFMFDTYGDGFINDDDAWYEARFNGEIVVERSFFKHGFKEVSDAFGNCQL